MTYKNTHAKLQDGTRLNICILSPSPSPPPPHPLPLLLHLTISTGTIKQCWPKQSPAVSLQRKQDPPQPRRSVHVMSVLHHLITPTATPTPLHHHTNSHGHPTQKGQLQQHISTAEALRDNLLALQNTLMDGVLVVSNSNKSTITPAPRMYNGA